MSLRAIPIRRVGNRANLVWGGDRELVLTSALTCGVLVFAIQELKAVFIGAALWFLSIYLLRLMAKSDPQMRAVYMRARRYKPYYPAQSTPFRKTDREYK